MTQSVAVLSPSVLLLVSSCRGFVLPAAHVAAGWRAPVHNVAACAADSLKQPAAESRVLDGLQRALPHLVGGVV